MSVPTDVQANTRQTPHWGSQQWFEITGRFRPAVESFFSIVKDPGKEHMARGRIKMMGLARNSIMVAFWTAAANFRLIDAFEWGEQHDDPEYRYLPRPPRRRRAIPYADRETCRDPPAAPAA